MLGCLKQLERIIEELMNCKGKIRRERQKVRGENNKLTLVILLDVGMTSIYIGG